MRIKHVSYPRAALIGNPSDGFYGKTIAFPFSNFQVEATLTTRQGILIPQASDEVYQGHETFYSKYLSEGGAGSKHILNATLKVFFEYCKEQGIKLHDQGFEIEFESTIPREVGLAGSSAIITAVFKTLLEFYEVTIALEVQANLILNVETKEMGISAGLQDRVVIVYEHPIYMNFDKQLMEERGYGDYQRLQASLFENIYIAYSTSESEGSEVVHNDLGHRYRNGDQQVHNVMNELSDLTAAFMNELNSSRKLVKLGLYMNTNFDLRQSICSISKNNLKMIQLAREVGASAKFTGSGGAIIGNFTSDAMYSNLEMAFKKNEIQIFKPRIVST